MTIARHFLRWALDYGHCEGIVEVFAKDRRNLPHLRSPVEAIESVKGGGNKLEVGTQK